MATSWGFESPCPYHINNMTEPELFETLTPLEPIIRQTFQSGNYNIYVVELIKASMWIRIVSDRETGAAATGWSQKNDDSYIAVHSKDDLDKLIAATPELVNV